MSYDFDTIQTMAQDVLLEFSPISMQM